MATYLSENYKHITPQALKAMKAEGEKISMLTAYDYTTAMLLDKAGIDMILVGDSAANVMAGHATTLPITLEQMIYHAQCVRRGVERALVICDMPFGSYQGAEEEAVRNAIRIMKETGVDAVKLEGGKEVVPIIRRLVAAGIPVCGHLGLTPQSVHALGGYGLQAKTDEDAMRLKEDTKALEAAGCFAIVFEKIPAALAKEVSQTATVPTIGIGAGKDCDGQVLVVDDMLGKNKGFRPKFVRRYADLHTLITTAVTEYITDVKSCQFPAETESY